MLRSGGVGVGEKVLAPLKALDAARLNAFSLNTTGLLSSREQSGS